MDPNSITICTVFPSLRPRDSLPRGRPCERPSAARRVLPREAAANGRKPQSPRAGKQTCLQFYFSMEKPPLAGPDLGPGPTAGALSATGLSVPWGL